MKHKIFEEIYDQFSFLFEKSSSEVFQCKEGWSRIIFEMLSAISSCSDIADLGVFKIISIEEKFGVLAIDAIIKFSEKLSYHQCEYCGDNGQLHCSTRYLHWGDKKILCKDHAVELLYFSIPNYKG